MDEAAIANAGNWLRLSFHVATCNLAPCQLGDRCGAGKELLAHIVTCSGGACTLPACTSVKRLLRHWLVCQDPACRLCSGVWSDLSSFHPAGQGAPGPPQPQAPGSPEQPEHPGTPERAPPPELHPGSAASPSYSGGGAALEPRLSGGSFASPTTPGPSNGLAPAVASSPVAGAAAARASQQLQEATSYLKYILHSLMCRTARDLPSRAPGVAFWLGMLGDGLAAGNGAGATGPLPWPQAAPQPSAGQRLLHHRLTCRNTGCAMCSGTCDLFVRGNALRQELPVPQTLNQMDDIVQALSMALASFNL
ncbi:hypothetical protein HYH03_014697 [Edaphochlamys debaryana]|uniref:TAZ-type domain-containing protein n=1 Tax=Edaphochlamys debaryana TaxID=47281 RepID=A0A836BRP5_9CHLO|nr:hypothetical protein HYH03_014697 [Edaphochlamys debaryana]|eukprot:KAG2486641.1 hypothetical protein HYH03_014697 [Edaphochlamys debaryana]